MATGSPLDPRPASAREPILSMEGLTLSLRGTPLVEDVSFTITPGEMLGLVGESGCGKSITALSIMGLLPTPPIAVAGGRILFEDRDLARLPEAEMRRLRGWRIGMSRTRPRSCGRRSCSTSSACPRRRRSSRAIPTSSPAASVSG